MTRAAVILLTIGVALFVALLAWQGLGSVTSTLMVAGWGLALVAAFHLVPLVLDSAAIAVLFDRRRDGVSALDALLARWTGESVNSLLPAGQIGGPVVIVRQLSQRGMRMRDAAAAITVSTTLQCSRKSSSPCSACCCSAPTRRKARCTICAPQLLLPPLYSPE